MATIYTDLHNKAKENVSVIRKPGFNEDGMTQQLVKFLNHGNEYWGVYHGTIDATSADIKNATIDGATIRNAILDNVSFKDGLNLDEFAAQFQALCDKIDEEISSRKACAGKIVDNLYKYIDLSGNFLSNQISSLSNDIVFEKHIKISTIDETKYPYTLSDWTVNNLETACPVRYAYFGKIDHEHVIGKIANVKYRPEPAGDGYIDYVDSFEFYLLNPTVIDPSLSALSKTRYQFSQTVSQIPLNSKYRLAWKNYSSSRIYDCMLAVETINGEFVKDLDLGEKSVVEMMMPNKKDQIPNIKDDDNRSEYFIVNVKFSDMIENGAVNSTVPEVIDVKFIPTDESEYKYTYLGKVMTDKQTIKLYKNRLVSLKFEELQEGVFQITDLNNTELVARTADIRNRIDVLMQKFDNNAFTNISVQNLFVADKPISAMIEEQINSVLKDKGLIS